MSQKWAIFQVDLLVCAVKNSGEQYPSLMNSIKAQPLAILTVLIGLLYPQISEANDFTAADLMGWEQKSRHAYFNNTVATMIALLSQAQTGYGKCIGDWYYSDSIRGNRDLDNAMIKYGQHDPNAVMISWLKHLCGPLPFKN